MAEFTVIAVRREPLGQRYAATVQADSAYQAEQIVVAEARENDVDLLVAAVLPGAIELVDLHTEAVKSWLDRPRYSQQDPRRHDPVRHRPTPVGRVHDPVRIAQAFERFPPIDEHISQRELVTIAVIWRSGLGDLTEAECKDMAEQIVTALDLLEA